MYSSEITTVQETHHNQRFFRRTPNTMRQTIATSEIKIEVAATTNPVAKPPAPEARQRNTRVGSMGHLPLAMLTSSARRRTQTQRVCVRQCLIIRPLVSACKHADSLEVDGFGRSV